MPLDCPLILFEGHLADQMTCTYFLLWRWIITFVVPSECVVFQNRSFFAKYCTRNFIRVLFKEFIFNKKKCISINGHWCQNFEAHFTLLKNGFVITWQKCIYTYIPVYIRKYWYIGWFTSNIYNVNACTVHYCRG